ncbi:MAG TPA: OB-fold nucleic acid binding domain-containing protein, partial [Leptospiraceae bacterium]|nr:OB-fold nucleic acid binding domain-containing protein [Leptospiraceae bacterium]
MASKEKSNAQKKPQQAPKPAPEAAPEHDASDLFETRLRKLEEARASQNPYDISYQRKNTVSEPASVAVDSIAEGTPGSLVVYNVAGRIRAKRLMGKAGFLDLEDETGRLQIYGTEKDASLDFNTFVSLDLGDIAGFEGTLFVTRTGQISLRATKMTLLAKCLRPLPVVKEADGKVFDAFTDKESRYRMRYVDLIVNPHVRKTFLIRSQIVSQIRSFLNAEGYLEVETPMMHPIPGGASAKPFTTHHNALDMELFLRIAPELYLKRLLVGGFSKVYEINRNFRNEGISFKHNPEFTMLELYEAYGDMNSMLDLCERLFVDL